MDILRCIIQETLQEAAKTINDAKVGKLAMYYASPPASVSFPSDRIIVLYNPDIFLKALNSVEDLSLLPYGEIIVGVIVLDDLEGECNNASTVVNVAAKKGYGPLMYNIAGATAPGGSIAPHRERGGVKGAARNVWNHYYSQGSVRAEPFDDAMDPRDDNPDNDCDLHGDEPLDHSYSGIRAPFGSLVQTHKKFIEAIKDIVDPNKLSEIIEEMGERYYYERYLSS